MFVPSLKTFFDFYNGKRIITHRNPIERKKYEQIPGRCLEKLFEDHQG